MLRADADSYAAFMRDGPGPDDIARIIDGLRVEAKYMGADGSGGNPDDRPEED